MIIGIDPDTDKSGIAVKHDKTITLYNYSFFQLFEFLKENANVIRNIRIEASWLIKKSNWHNETSGARVASKIGNSTGANHETGRKIVEMCEHLNIPFELIKPLRKVWTGPDGKITHKELLKIIPCIYKYDFKKSNQEQRDACLLIVAV